jgi:3-isopropylmalate/(R)-2-methylmalate dehydratase small subunit
LQPFTIHRGLCATLSRDDVDTDQIIPKQFLKRTDKDSYGQACFFDWRYDQAGTLNPDFELNHARFRGASILITGQNFGCGSSREHAAWALLNYGFRAVIAPSFADIFKTNALQNGLLPVSLPAIQVKRLRDRAQSADGCELSIDLVRQVISDATAEVVPFEIDEFWRQCLLQGMDPISMAEGRDPEITAYERQRSQLLPTTAFLKPGT